MLHGSLDRIGVWLRYLTILYSVSQKLYIENELNVACYDSLPFFLFLMKIEESWLYVISLNFQIIFEFLGLTFSSFSLNIFINFSFLLQIASVF